MRTAQFRAGSVMGGRHEAPKPGTDVVMALVILALAALLAAVITLSLLDG